LRDILDKLETPAVRWALVCIGVVILVRLKLILFAAALPVMAYWHYSNNSSEEPADASAGAAGDEQTASGQDRGRDDDDDEYGRDDFGGNDNKDEEVYDKDFWDDKKSGERQAPRSAPSNDASRLDDKSGVKKDNAGLWDEDPAGGPVGDLPKAKSNMDDILSSLGGLTGDGGDDDFGLGKIGNDFDFLGSGGDDFDFGGFGGGGKGKGKGKKGDKGGFGGEKGDKGPREANPKQVFVAGIGDLQEDEIRAFFEEAGEVDRLKVLTTPEGDSKGVCFVTFGSEEQAQAALRLHGSNVQGRTITVRLAHGGNKGEKGGEKGGGGFGGGGKGGGFGGGSRDRGPDMDRGSERFGAAFGDSERGDRPERSGGKGKGKGKGRQERSELDELLEEALADQEGPVKASDFDFAARRFLSEVRSRDRADDTKHFDEALDMVFKYTSSKDRGSVRKWPAYIFTLLQKFDPKLWEELRERDASRRAQGNDRGGGGGFSRDRPPRNRDDDGVREDPDDR